jgi:hypothetical protein
MCAAAAAADPVGEACGGDLGTGHCQMGEGARQVPSNRPLACSAVKHLHNINIFLHAAGASKAQGAHRRKQFVRGTARVCRARHAGMVPEIQPQRVSR